MLSSNNATLEQPSDREPPETTLAIGPAAEAERLLEASASTFTPPPTGAQQHVSAPLASQPIPTATDQLSNSAAAPPNPQQGSDGEQHRYIREAFDDIRTDIRWCYQSLLDENPHATDRLVIEVAFSVDEEGQETVSAELLSIESGEWQIEDLSCFAEVVDGMQIPLSEDTTAGQRTVRYPFRFTSAAGQ